MPPNLSFLAMFGLKKKLCVFGPIAMSALLILAMLVASVECGDDGMVSSSRMMQENMVDGTAATSVPRNTVLVSDHHTPTLYIFK